MKRFLAVFFARNLEFFRDKTTFFWNLLLPVFLIFGFAFAFSGNNSNNFKVGDNFINIPELDDENLSKIKPLDIEIADFYKNKPCYAIGFESAIFENENYTFYKLRSLYEKIPDEYSGLLEKQCTYITGLKTQNFAKNAANQ